MANLPSNRWVKLSPFVVTDLMVKVLIILLAVAWAVLLGRALDFNDPWKGVEMMGNVFAAFLVVRYTLPLYHAVIHERGFFTVAQFLAGYLALLGGWYLLALKNALFVLLATLPFCLIAQISLGVIRRRFPLFKGLSYRSVKPYGWVRRYYAQRLRASDKKSL